MKAADLGTEANGEAVQREIDELTDGRNAQLQERVARCRRERQPVEGGPRAPRRARRRLRGRKRRTARFPLRHRIHREPVEADGDRRDEPGADELGVQRRRPLGKRAEQAQEPLGVEPEDAGLALAGLDEGREAPEQLRKLRDLVVDLARGDGGGA
mgnify:CR=1 FL=1